MSREIDNKCLLIKFPSNLMGADGSLSAAPRRTIQWKGVPADTN